MNQNQSKQIAKESKSSFYYAFNLLPEEKRDAMNTVYAFCRKTDDIVDEGEEPEKVKYENLRKWRHEFEKALQGKSNYPLFNKLIVTIRRFNIPIDPFFDLIKGMEIDLQQQRFDSFSDLLDYCYKVASTVGLISIEIFGYKHESTRQFAIKLGYALQLTNILRDIKKDAERGRIYLPREDLYRFNYSEEELFRSEYNENFVNLMKFETARAKEFFTEATRSLDYDDKPAMFAARAMQHIYFRLLKRIEENNFDVYSKNINVPKIEKVGIALGVWAKYSLVY